MKTGKLILELKVGETIKIGNDTLLTAFKTGNERMKLGIEAPIDLPILRSNAKVLQKKPVKAKPVKAKTVKATCGKG